jgi:serine/threonine protein kinase
MSTADADDDEKTITGPRTRGHESALAQPGHMLPLGTRLRDYEITGLIGEGGFGIVYLAWDHSLQRKVAIKEYMPASMAARVNGSSAIVVKSERHLDTFRAGLKSFVNEARLLARFDHPSLVKVYRFWEENGTAYMVMPYYEGPTLKAALAALGRPPSEAELRAWLQPLLDALAVMHAAQCFHRDIAPDNILLTPRGPLLLDFGAARRVIGDMTHAITVVLKPGYAPIEQYGDVATMTQGAWTDLYALASVVYFAIVGRTPTSSVERLMDDRLEPLSVTAAGRYGAGFLRAIDAALAVRPGDRPQTEREFRALLDADRPVLPRAEPSAAEQTVVDPPRSAAVPRSASISEPAAAGLPRADAAFAEAPPAAVPARVAAPHARRTPALLLIAAALAVVVVVAGVVFLRADRGAAAPAPTTRSASAAVADNAASATVTAPSSDAPALPSPTGSTTAARPDEAAGPRPGEVDRGAETPAPAATVDVAPTDTPPTYAPPTQASPAQTSPAQTSPTHTPPTTSPTTSPTRSAPPRRAAAVPRGEPAPPIKTPAENPTPPRAATNGARCSDILQKASLEPLTASETAYLKRECR